MRKQVKRIANQLKLNWRPIFTKMQAAPSLPSLTVQQLNQQMLEMTFNIATEHLKTQICSYVWDKYSNYDNWQVSTWSKRVKYSEIMQHGHPSDISNLPEETRFNQKEPPRPHLTQDANYNSRTDDHYLTPLLR